MAASLNELSQKLRTTLDELQTANTMLQADIDFEREQERKRLAFFSVVSHELKTPITIMKGQVEGMLCNVGAYKENEKYLQRSLVVANTMEGLVQEILTVSRVEAASFTLNQAKIEFSGLVKQCLQEQEDLLLMKQMQLTTQIKPRLYLYGDEKLLKKAVSNIIYNAIHYSPA